MKLMQRLLILLLLLPFTAWAQVEVNGVRMWPAPDNTRLVFDITGPVEHALFTLEGPNRVVIDIKNTRLIENLSKLEYAKSLIKSIRSAPRNGGDLRVVLDLRKQVRPKSFVLRPNKEYGHRLVIDLSQEIRKGKARAENRITKSISNKDHRDVVIAVDAGHGGEDPGASGPSGLKEKTIVLSIAHKLKRLIDKEPGMRAVLIRDGDYYVGLKDRVKKARNSRADMFVSIHADAFHNPRARGSSVFTLSQSGASSEHAQLIAEKENAADLIGGVSLDDKDDLLKSVLLDLSQTATNEASMDVGANVLKGLKRVGKVHKSRVEQAGFRVLKSPDIPSILVETAFISNPAEERKLRTATHQNALADAIAKGVKTYFRDNPPPGTVLAMVNRKHVIARGETLTIIARNYSTNLSALREFNNIRGDKLRVGEVLVIPPG
ncbi:MAG: N-acetylmuramoyl-L-alanine amidase [Gammaproteobacteria bacterium]|nr:N-acetylmuramoyl-L-alanine amidase [Gammaproteobacteria bacterium]